MNVQKDHSHGLCQTYALMFYCSEDKRLKKGNRNYYKNVIIGFTFLYDFILADYTRDRVWRPTEILDTITVLCENHDDERLDNLRKIGKQEIYLSDLIDVIIDSKHRANLRKWFGSDY